MAVNLEIKVIYRSGNAKVSGAIAALDVARCGEVHHIAFNDALALEENGSARFYAVQSGQRVLYRLGFRSSDRLSHPPAANLNDLPSIEDNS